MNVSPFGPDNYSWLIYADWLDENGEGVQAELIRDEIGSGFLSPWNWEYRVGGVGVGGVGGGGGVGGSVGGVGGG